MYAGPRSCFHATLPDNLKRVSPITMVSGHVNRRPVAGHGGGGLDAAHDIAIHYIASDNKDVEIIRPLCAGDEVLAEIEMEV
jgi:hypothetical protein